MGKKKVKPSIRKPKPWPQVVREFRRLEERHEVEGGDR
jgi:hypothetical protein